jgi:protease-4
MHTRRIFAIAIMLALGLAFLPARADDAAKPAAAVAAANVAHIKLSGDFDEAAAAGESLFSPGAETIKIKLDRIAKAKKDDTVKALYLQIDGLSLGWGKMHELRTAILDFRKSGKKVHAYMEDGGTMDYLIAAACDEVVMPESGTLMLTGLRYELTFYKDLLDLLGLKADAVKMGDFKGAVEPFTRNSISPENRKQWDELADDNWNQLAECIAASRQGYTPEKVKQVLDDGPFTAKRALALGLVDRLAYPDGFQDGLKQALKAEKVAVKKDYGKKKSEETDFSNPFALLKLLAPAKDTRLSDKPKVAVIYATGSIVSGKSGFSLLGGQSIGSTTMVEAIHKAEEEPTVKAIVLRVDSPGGSALASDIIWNELTRCKKPVIASMSDTAASGGYYISMGAKKIFAEPGTLTGSIGVFGMKIVLGGLYEKGGVKTEVIARGKNSGINSTTTPFSESERKAMEANIQDIYDTFLDKAWKGRQASGNTIIKSREELKKLAGGRIWTGRQAKQNGLIDELGTLDDAIAAAKQMAGLKADDEVELYQLPKGGSMLDSLFDREASLQAVLSAKLSEGHGLVPELMKQLRGVEFLLQSPKSQVWAVLPYRVEIR